MAAHGVVTCLRGLDESCDVHVTLPAVAIGNVTDHMLVTLEPKPGQALAGHDINVLNLWNALGPVVDWISDDKTHFRGRNLVGGSLRAGLSKASVALECADMESRNDCKVAKIPAVAQEEFLYLVVGNNLLPMRSAATGAYLTVLPPAHPAGVDGVVSRRDPALTQGAVPSRNAAPSAQPPPAAASDAKKKSGALLAY